ncbi:MAG: hypothetical protein COA66_05290 [Arcobacter sp.]|nr:MAG: hypothetical protein COA66_05290 [Arcobacter sp.]
MKIRASVLAKTVSAKTVSANVLVQVITLVCVNVKIVVKIIHVASRMLVVIKKKGKFFNFPFFI